MVQSIIITALLALDDRVFHGNTASMVEFALDWHRMECTECFNSIAQQSVSFRNAWTNSGNPDLFIVPGIESTLRIIIGGVRELGGGGIGVTKWTEVKAGINAGRGLRKNSRVS